MSETPEKTDATRPSLRKQPAKDEAGGTPKKLPTPRTIDYACIALGVSAAALLVRALLLLGGTSTLKTYLINANNNAGSKKQSNYVADHLTSDLHALRQGALLMGVVLAVALGLLVFALRRTRTASGSRWAMLIIMVFTQLPFSVIPATGFPTGAKIVGVFIGIGAIVAIVFVFLPKQSQQYFRDCRDAATPPELRGQPRPSLFGPRRPRPGQTGPAGAGRTGANPRTSSVRSQVPDSRPATGTKSRAKVRTDAEAVANGADLARSRAKASKSRRTPD